MKPKEAVLERRRLALHAKIAAQREHFAEQLEIFRGPLHTFEVARGFGERIRRHAPIIGAVATGAGLVLMRGGILSKAMSTMRLVRRTTTWWGVGKLALRLMQRRPMASV